MTSKENILAQIRNSRREAFPMPSFDQIAPICYEDGLEQLKAVTQTVGGKVIVLEPDQNVNELIRTIYPDAKVIASSLPYIDAELDPDKVNEASGLNGVDVGVVEGRVAVAENGCIWVPQTMKERAVLFISECLVIIIDRKDIVSNMHQAYEMIDNSGYGCFISGPSKTADIAQALVMGAQAARGVTVLVR
jgi:L-lactate dehydrogenase complex protein LldG